ncbi:hypothetical protein GCM10011610_30280 [Nocardia rhizosphaerihabitans]|uniref:Aminoglycoside phosphotransferase domain-containing protein n=1 Tax=Nocardia rhizosphaerihabitans TaxID=1691570 RepID=A0ABQ2KEW1_9NOCA|nr:hypothetical protein GCM10011610_30280 [Nocardia rhizosphaerihabitans]
MPRAVLLEEDESVRGGAFAIAEFVDGASLQTRDDFAAVDDTALAGIVDDLAGTLAALHRVDHVAVGLERFGRPDEYAARQLRRWSGQWEMVGTPDLQADGVAVAAELAARVPEQLSTGIVHGDYRIDNTLIDVAARKVVAVVDWELSTIRDPVADVAMMCAYRHPALDLILGQPSAWTSERLPKPIALAEAYERAGGVPLAHWSFHMALAYFKIGVIAAGIEHRRQAGAGGSGHDTAGDSVATYLELARTALRD